MKPPLARRSPSPQRRGAALLLSLMVLIVVGLIVYQIDIVVRRDSQVARNDITATQMDLAIESSLLQVYETLAEDAAAGAAAADGGLGGTPADDGSAMDPTGGDEPTEEGEGSVDSKMDGWAQPQATYFGDLSLRIIVQDEDSKYNVLNMLAADELRAEESFDRVVRILDACRENTTEDIDTGDAETMARVMLEHLQERERSVLPRVALLSDSEEEPDQGMPLTMREFVVLEPFEERHFRDYFDEDGQRVHSISSFLTIYTSVRTSSSDDEVGGYSVNVNTAPLAVLQGLMDRRDVDQRFWEGVVEYRNEEEEPEDGEEPAEPMLDEFGEEVFPRKFFDDLGELDEVYDWALLEPGAQDQLEQLLKVNSSVFSIYITARLPTAEQQFQVAEFRSRREQEEYERSGAQLVRTVRSVVWRRDSDDGAEIVPLVRWEVLSDAPLEVRDYADEEYY